MPRFLLSAYQPDGNPPPPDVLGAIMRNVAAVRDDMQAAGVLVMTAGLSAAGMAKVVRPKGDTAFTTDGPFVEAKEHIGGFTLVEAPNLDAALEWARKLARATTLPIEVRALQAF